MVAYCLHDLHFFPLLPSQGPNFVQASTFLHTPGPPGETGTCPRPAGRPGESKHPFSEGLV